MCLGLIIPTMAQDTAGKADPTVNRRGIALLPQAGDFAIGISANPFLEYLGGFMGGNSSSAPYFEGLNQTIYAKYFIQDNAAIRAKISLDFSQTKNKETIKDDYALLVDPTNTGATTIDSRTIANNAIDLNLGYEMRRGKGRVQGFYGAEVLLGFGKKNVSYDYGNPITATNQTPTITTEDPDGTTPIPGQGYRVLKSKGGLEFNAGLGVFAGVEYFFVPQISIGGELGLGFGYFNKAQDEVKSEGFLGNGIKEYEYRVRNAGDEAFNTGVRTVTKGEIFVIFHF